MLLTLGTSKVNSEELIGRNFDFFFSFSISHICLITEMVLYISFKNSLIIHKEKQKKLIFNQCLCI